MAKGGSGFKNGKSNSSFRPISLAGKTGTEKQKAYAENLLESARMTARENGVAGYSDTGGVRRYIPQKDADAVKGAYEILRFSVENRKTYGEVIDLMKRQDIIDLSRDIKVRSERSGKSINQFVDDMIKAAKKKMKK